VIEVLVAVGDEVAVDQGLIVLESDKASMEIPSTVAGTVVELLVATGQQLAEGAPVAVIEVAQQDDPAAQETSSTPTEDEPADAEEDRAGSAGEPAVESAKPSAPGTGSEQTVSVPDIGTDEAVELIEVCVAVGDTVAEGDSLVALESDKASMEVPAPFGGEVIELLVKTGDQVRQGDKLLVMRGDAPAVEKVAEPESAPAPAASAPAAAPERKTEAAPVADAPAEVSEAAAGEASGSYAGPAVRKLAREFGVSLQQVSGSGPRGRILKEDVQKYVQKALGKQPAGAVSGAGIPAIPEIDFAKFGPVELTERSKLDKLTAANMHRSWLNVPHVTQFDEADITALEEFRAGLKPEAEQRGTRLTPMPFILKACAVALRDNPKFNSSLAAGGEQLAQKGYIHIGMAVDTPAGLVVPVIRDVDKKTIWELAAEVLALAGKARDRKLSPGDMQGGCFTVSSLGNIGGNGFTPIVNAPEVGILGVSKAAIKPVWDGREFAPRNMLPLALSYDHRVINGGDGGRFMTQLVSLLGDIRQLLM
jgi:pyruvate dehydrogenase E2 component (dihydrolipoamide acetyltransferase)